MSSTSKSNPAVASAAKFISIQLPRKRPDHIFDALLALRRSSEFDEFECHWTPLALNAGTWWLSQILAGEGTLSKEKRVFAVMLQHVLLVGDPYLNSAARLSGARSLFAYMPPEVSIIWLYSCMATAVIVYDHGMTLPRKRPDDTYWHSARTQDPCLITNTRKGE